ncbi:MAG: 16S rRNA (guanine(527)-N(7))-methyltransferase RsmG [Methylovirgula sp.]|jgi:16S rRNA (guanine527-N7)-methyltransferase
MAPDPDAADRAAALKLFPLPQETIARLTTYAELLRKWKMTINLVASSTLPFIWTRHFADSLQVQAALPDARLWVDLGSGAGFPGLVTAIKLIGQAGAKVHLIESNERKCAFLREVSRETQASAEVHQGRIEDVLPEISGPIDAVSARALAPLPELIAYAAEALDKGAVGAFLKGEQVADELTPSQAADRLTDYDITSIPSVTSASGRLLIVKKK